jgi:large conductance mechanosensitive channel
MGFVQEFREFAVKGNAVDMAVGIVLGVAFNKIVSSLVNDVIMPPVGMLLGETDFRDLAWELKSAAVVNGAEIPGVYLRYGQFVNTVIEFLIVALSLFVVVKVMNRVLRSRENAPAP